MITDSSRPTWFPIHRVLSLPPSLPPSLALSPLPPRSLPPWLPIHRVLSLTPSLPPRELSLSSTQPMMSHFHQPYLVHLALSPTFSLSLPLVFLALSRALPLSFPSSFPSSLLSLCCTSCSWEYALLNILLCLSVGAPSADARQLRGGSRRWQQRRPARVKRSGRGGGVLL